MNQELNKRTMEFLEQATIALKHQDRSSARRLAQQAVQADPSCGAAWQLLADLSTGHAKDSYQERADALNNPKSSVLYQEPSNRPDSGQSLREYLQTHKSDDSANDLTLTQPAHKDPKRRHWIFPTITGALFFLILSLSLLIWFTFPGRQTVSAADHSSPRLAGELMKPSLTPTETPLPTATSTVTPTSTAVPTDTPEPLLAADSGTDVLAPIPAIPSVVGADERWIDVDLTNQRTYAYEGTQLIRTFIVSTGTQYHPTVTGEYRIYVKYRYTDMAGPGYYLPDVPFTMYFYKGYSLHGTYWHNNFGVPMSHGCVNLSIPDAEWLYYWASVGTLVNVHY